MLASKPGGLSSVSGTLMVEGKKDSHNLTSDFHRFVGLAQFSLFPSATQNPSVQPVDLSRRSPALSGVSL